MITEEVAKEGNAPAMIIGNRDTTITEYTVQTKDQVTARNTGYPDNETQADKSANHLNTQYINTKLQADKHIPLIGNLTPSPVEGCPANPGRVIGYFLPATSNLPIN